MFSNKAKLVFFKQEKTANKTPFALLCDSKAAFINAVLERLKLQNKPEHSDYNQKVVMEAGSAYDYTIQYCETQKNHNPLFFLSILSDILWVEEKSLHSLFEKFGIVLPVLPNNALDNSDEHFFNEEQLDENNYSPEVSAVKEALPFYCVSSEMTKHPLFGNDYVSCYPKEQFKKETINTRFAAKFDLPEKRNKYARPQLDIEFTPGDQMPCVRCYLTLTNRPRMGFQDKNITQQSDGHIVFSHVQLMNFGDPLRALTWAEDYAKNPEHGPNNQPIIRTFLIPLATYNILIAQAVAVDTDRAPGQVKSLDTTILQAVNFSLVSFINHEVTSPADGVVKKLEELSGYLLGRQVHPKDIAPKSFLAHQYGRFQLTSQEEIYWANSKDSMVLARQLERELAGYALHPKKEKPFEQMNLSNSQDRRANKTTDTAVTWFN